MLKMTQIKINVKDKRIIEPEYVEPIEQMELVITNDRINLNTSNGYCMLSLNLRNKDLYFADMEYYTDADQRWKKIDSEHYKIVSRCKKD